MADNGRAKLELETLAKNHGDGFGAVLIDPPWRFINRTGKMAPEHRRLARYQTMSVAELEQLAVGDLAKPASHMNRSGFGGGSNS